VFALKENNTSFAIEASAGFAIFLSMAYVLSVNPYILEAAGMPKEALFTATAVGTIIGTLIMCFVAKLPFAVAPGMGLNAFFAYSVVGQMGLSWQQALTAVFAAGVLFFLLSLSPLRQQILKEVPESLQYAVAAGIGLMIAYIGLKNGGLVALIPSPDGSVSVNLGGMTRGAGLLTIIGLFVTAVFLALNWRFALLLGIVATTLIGIPLGVTDISGITASTVFTRPPSLAPIALQFDFAAFADVQFWAVAFTFLFMCVFDSLAGFIGLFSVMGDEAERHRPRVGRAFIADSVGVAAGAALGLSPNTAYAESGAGVAVGGRTGLTALTVAVLFFVCLFFSKIFLAVPSSAVAPALVLVGLLMLASLRRLNFADKTESFPAFVIIILTCLTWRISDSLAVGWIIYILMRVVGGKIRSITPTVWVVGALFALKEVLAGG
jgi:AGZA family xanthine/uracil permease-like MFS transporter